MLVFFRRKMALRLRQHRGLTADSLANLGAELLLQDLPDVVRHSDCDYPLDGRVSQRDSHLVVARDCYDCSRHCLLFFLFLLDFFNHTHTHTHTLTKNEYYILKSRLGFPGITNGNWFCDCCYSFRSILLKVWHLNNLGLACRFRFEAHELFCSQNVKNIYKLYIRIA